MRRSRAPVATTILSPFCFLDLDHLKEINDRYGHIYGSRVLRSVAILLQGRLRGSDKIFRFGGDEFVVTLPETDSQQAGVVVQRLSGGPEASPHSGPQRDSSDHHGQLWARYLSLRWKESRGTDPPGRPAHVPGEKRGPGSESDPGYPATGNLVYSFFGGTMEYWLEFTYFLPVAFLI